MPADITVISSATRLRVNGATRRLCRQSERRPQKKLACRGLAAPAGGQSTGWAEGPQELARRPDETHSRAKENFDKALTA